MSYPRIIVDLKKIKNNVDIISERCRRKGISVMGITKSFCGSREVIEVLKASGIDMIGDSRLENLEKASGINVKKALIRLPMISEAEKAVKETDITFNSEYETILKLNEEAAKIDRIHEVIIMIEMGDLREGIEVEEVENLVEKSLKLKNIKIIGIGANFSCYGGVLPDEEKIYELSEIAEKIEKKFNLKLEIISGGNSSSLYLLEKGEFYRINNLRIGEAIVLGRETAFGTKIKGCYEDAFILEGEIIEIKDKPSMPKGKLGFNAFGEKPRIEDLGIRRRAILALGRQDIDYQEIYPKDKRIRVVGASSDHLILDITDSEIKYKLGDIISFNVGYGTLLRGMASQYIKKIYK